MFVAMWLDSYGELDTLSISLLLFTNSTFIIKYGAIKMEFSKMFLVKIGLPWLKIT